MQGKLLLKSIKKNIKNTILFGFLFGFCAPIVFSQSLSADSGTVISVAVEGNQHFSSTEILSKLQTKPGDPYNRFKIREDIKKIYQMGFFAEVAADDIHEKNGIKVTFLVKENPIVKDFLFVGNKAYKDKRLKSELKFEQGKVYQEGAIQAYIGKLKDFYKDKQYLVDVQGKVEKVNDDYVNLKFIITEEKKGRILEVVIEGNHAIRSKVIKKAMKSRNSWLFVSHYYDPLVYEEDQEKIEGLYKDKGYVLVKVTMEEPQVIPNKNGVLLRIVVEEGPQYRTGKIDISGNRLFSAKEVEAAVHSKTGSVYNQSEMEKDSGRLYDLYADQGYVITEVNHQLSLDTEKRIVDVSYEIRESIRSFVGKITFKGVSMDKNKLVKPTKGYEEVPLKTKDKVIRRELTLEPGDVLRKDEMVRTQERLQRLGFFEGVDVRPEPTASADTLDLVLYLAEKQTGTIQFGVGYSTEKKAEIFTDLQENNLFGSGNSLRFKVDLAQEGSGWDITYTEPYFMDTRIGLTLSLYRDVLDETIDGTQIGTGVDTSNVYEEKQTGASVTLSYPVQQYLTGSLQLQIKQVKLAASDDNPSFVIPAPLGPTDSWSHIVTPGITYDSRDNVFWPTRGVRYMVTTDFAGGPLGGDNNYIKFYAEGNWYKKFSDRFIAAVRARGGYIDAYDGTADAPIPDRFFLGGANTVRGFDFRGISPVVTYTDTTNNEIETITVGGDVMLNFNFELRTKITERFIGVLFLDSGGVWDNVEDVNLGQLRFGVGPGIVVNLPIGYFQVGYGFPFNIQPGDSTQGPYFTFGSTF
jgi:outer membrane protein insertion porin family